MIDSLEVDLPLHEPAYRSFRDAAEAAARSTRTARARRDNMSIRDAHIKAFGIRGSLIELLLSDQRVMRIGCIGVRVDWHFVPGHAFTVPPRLYAEEVTLTLPTKDVIKWHPYELLRKRLDAPGIEISPTETFVYLLIGAQAELKFGQMIDSKGNQLLFLHES
ncbi:MAG: hypothetical protein IPM29_14965 [Planctomycetes bacterium]|nr:hypothetical protein [Planctomycetota bacterium]